jgi:hypothetical protein
VIYLHLVSIGLSTLEAAKKGRQSRPCDNFVTVVVNAPIRLTARKVLARWGEGPERVDRSLVGGVFGSLLVTFMPSAPGPEQVGEADQVVGQHMQPEHRSHF